VSITKGCKGAKKQIQKNLDKLLKFDEVILMFDMDEPGQQAAVQCATLFPPGRCKIARLSMKDPNELHLAGKSDEIITAKFNAKAYRPDGIVTMGELRDRVMRPPEQGLPWWDERLTKLTYGRRLGETYGFGAGTGVGKTDWFTEQMCST
jgi:twinkle protein